MRWDARTYDRVAGPQTSWGAEVLGRLPLRGDECVLDAGCGTGRVTEQLEANLTKGHVVALDASEAMALAARSRLQPRSSIVVADLGETLPFGEDSFDAVFSTATFHWIRDHEGLYRNLARVLRAGGRLVAQCGGYGNISAVFRALKSIGAEELAPWNFATADEASLLLENNGVAEVDTWLHDEPTSLGSIDELAAYLSTCVLHPWFDRLPENQHAQFASAVAQHLPDMMIDFVRLNISARAI